MKSKVVFKAININFNIYLFWSVQEIVIDSEYEIPFQSGINKLTIKISLGHEFPKEKPILAINPLIYHPWINEKGFVIAAPGLVNVCIKIAIYY